MEDFSLYVLDITMNSVRAGASNIDITLKQDDEFLYVTIKDDGCGMTKEQLNKLENPFFTTRKTRKVGLGIPFFTQLAKMTDGYVKIASKHESEYEDHGTVIEGKFGYKHIDFIPIGNMPQTVVTLIQGSPDVDFTFTHSYKDKKVFLATSQLREILGSEISLASIEILNWISSSLKEQYEELNIKK